MSKKKDKNGHIPINNEEDVLPNWVEHQPGEEVPEHPTRSKIALDTLSRYSDVEVSEFNDFILLTNFPHYVDMFAKVFKTKVIPGTVFRSAHSKVNNISIIDYRVGSPMAALVVDVLSEIHPQAVVMLGLCGGLHKQSKIGDFLLPVAAIRDEGTSKHYMPPQVPSLPAFLVQQFISEELMEQEVPFHTGVLHTTDYRMWEFDKLFREKLRQEKAGAIEMECSALFSVGFARKVPVGALMLISDLPLKPDGIKTKKLAREFFKDYTERHLVLGVDCMLRMNHAKSSDNVNFRRFNF